MIRKQVYIEDSMDRGLKLLAARSGRPEAAHVREALKEYLDRKLLRAGRNPLAELTGLVPDAEGPDDAAENHDRYLYSQNAPPA
jgi:hypothetical protein